MGTLEYDDSEQHRCLRIQQEENPGHARPNARYSALPVHNGSLHSAEQVLIFSFYNSTELRHSDVTVVLS